MLHAKLSKQQATATRLVRESKSSLRAVQVMARDLHLQRLVAIWHLVPVGPAPVGYRGAGDPPEEIRAIADLEVAEQLAVAWEGLAPDAVVMRQLLGDALPVASVASRAIRLGLVLPDGTLPKYVDRWIAGESMRLLKRMPDR